MSRDVWECARCGRRILASLTYMIFAHKRGCGAVQCDQGGGQP